jgi:hypothetical protein
MVLLFSLIIEGDTGALLRSTGDDVLRVWPARQVAYSPRNNPT